MERLSFDLVILGGGIAGLSALIAAQEKGAKVLLVTKGVLFGSGSTFVNQNGRWGITYGTSENEKQEIFARINAISRGTNVPGLSEILVEESHAAYRRLKEWGVRFLRTSFGEDARFAPCFLETPVASIIESTGQFARVVGARLDRSVVEIMEGTAAKELTVVGNRCTGCVLDLGGKEISVEAGAVIMATGGGAANFAKNIVEPGLTGDGYRILREVGLELKNMDYVQRIWQSRKTAAGESDFTLSHFWDENIVFKNSQGNIINKPEFAPETIRERRSHAVIANLQEDRAIDEHFLAKLPDSSPGRGLCAYARNDGKYLYEIEPCVQACNGGVKIGHHGETGMESLYAAGEVATGMHGGDRMGGMMICAALVFGRRAAFHALNHRRKGISEKLLVQ